MAEASGSSTNIPPTTTGTAEPQQATSSSSSEETHVRVKSEDGREFKVSIEVAKMWKDIWTIFEDWKGDGDRYMKDDEDAVPISNINGETLEKVIEWCEHYVNEPGKSPFPPLDEMFDDLDFDDSDVEEEDDPQLKEIKKLQNMKVPEWDKTFLTFNDQEGWQNILLNVTEAANYLHIEDLLNICCKTVAELLTNKQPKEINELFGIPCDYTPEELSELRKELSWCEGLGQATSSSTSTSTSKSSK